MTQNKAIVNEVLEEFFKNVDEIAKPYFEKFNYRRRRLKGRSIVLFEKTIRGSTVAVDYFCYIRYGMRAFRVTFNSLRLYLHTIVRDDTSDADEPWKYEDVQQLRTLLSESIRRIDEQRLLQAEEELD